MTTLSPRDEADAAELALEMMVRAYQALATLYDLALLGKYQETHDLMKAFLVDNFRHFEGRIDEGLISEPAFKASVLRVREILLRVEQEVCPTSDGKAQIATSVVSQPMPAATV